MKSSLENTNIIESLILKAIEDKLAQYSPSDKIGVDDVRIVIDKFSNLYFLFNDKTIRCIDVYAIKSKYYKNIKNIGQLYYSNKKNTYHIDIIELDKNYLSTGLGTQLLRFFEYKCLKNGGHKIIGCFYPFKQKDYKVAEFYYLNGYKISRYRQLSKKLDKNKVEKDNKTFKIGKYNCIYAEKVIQFDDEYAKIM